MARQYQDTETRRRQVAEAALRTIVEDGVCGFTTRAIASRVGISDGTLFRHFGSKQEIILEAMSHLEARLRDGLVSTGDPLQDLETFFRHRALLVGAEQSVGRLIFSDGLVQLAGEQGREIVTSWRDMSVGYLGERLDQLREQGRVKHSLDVPAVCTLMKGTLLTFAMQASLGRSGSLEELQQRIDEAWNTLQLLLFEG